MSRVLMRDEITPLDRDLASHRDGPEAQQRLDLVQGAGRSVLPASGPDLSAHGDLVWGEAVASGLEFKAEEFSSAGQEQQQVGPAFFREL